MMTTVSSYAPAAFLHGIDNAECCFVFFTLVVIVTAVLIERVWKRKKNKCPACHKPHQQGAIFCSHCGTTIEGRKTPRSFYPHLSRRIQNWLKWGWIDSSFKQRLEQLHEADEQVFQGQHPSTLQHMVLQSGESDAPIIDFSEYEVAADEEVLDSSEGIVPEQQKTADISQLSTPWPSGSALEKQSALERVVAAESKPVLATPVQPPRKLSDILRTFMDANNIKLGEFVAGLLIVVGSIGLVTALSATFRDIPYLPSVVFLTVVALFHLAGIYSFRKWNLTSSSRVVLLIGNLLIPLNVLMTTMGDTSLQENKIYFVLAILVAAVSFGAMSFYSARILSPKRPWPLIIGLMGPCFCQLVIKLTMTQEGFAPTVLSTNALILLPIAIISFGILSEHRYFRKQSEVTTDDAFSLLRVLGLSLFSLGSAVALLFHRIDSKELAIELSQQLSNPLMILCFIVVSSGMLIYRRVSPADNLKLQMGGMWMVVTGTMGVVISLSLAVPHLDSMIVASFTGTVLALIFGYVTRISFLTAAGTLCLGVGVWTVYLKTQFDLPDGMLSFVQLRDSLGDGVSSVLFTVVAVVAGILHYLFATIENRDRPEFSKAGYLGVLLLAAVGFLCALAAHLPGVDSPHSDLTLGVFTVYAVGALVASLMVPHKAVHIAATILTAIASFQFAHTQFIEDWDWLPAVTTLGRMTVMFWTLMIVYSVMLVVHQGSGLRRVSSPSRWKFASTPFGREWTVGVSTTVYLVCALLQFFYIYLGLEHYSVAVGHSVLLVIVSLLIAVSYRTDWTWMLVQVQGIVATCAVVTLVQSRSAELFEFWGWEHLRIQVLVLAVGMIAWTVIRKACQQSSRAKEIVVTDLMYVDFFLHALATVAVYVIWVFSVVEPLHSVYPDSKFLHSIISFYGGLQTDQAIITMTDWSLWVINLMAWILVVTDRHRRISSFCGLLTLSALPILASTSLTSGSGEVDVNLIHYLKWGYGVFGLVATSLICSDRYWWRALQVKFPRWMANQDQKSEGENAEHTWMALRIVSFIAASLPVIVLTAAHFVYTSSVSGIGTDFNELVLLQPAEASLTAAKWNFAGPFFLLVVAAWICALRSFRPLYLIIALPMWLLGWMFFDLINVWADGIDLTVAAGFGTLKWALLGLGLYGLVWACAGVKTAGHQLHKLFQRTSAANLFYELVSSLAVLFMLTAMFDAFIVIDAVDDIFEWQDGWRNAFADWSALLVAFILPLICWMFDRQWNRNRTPSLCVIALFTLNAIVAHLLVLEVPKMAVLFNQTIGWLIGMTAIVLGFGYLARVKAGGDEPTGARWSVIRLNHGNWLAWLIGLSALSYVSIALFWSSTTSQEAIYSDQLLLALMGWVVLCGMVFSQWTQDTVSNIASLLFFVPFLILMAFKISGPLLVDEMFLDRGLISNLGLLLDENILSVTRFVLAGLGLYGLLSYVIQRGCETWMRLPAHPDQTSLVFRRSFITVSITAFVIHSLAAFGWTPHSTDLVWIFYPVDLAVILILLLAIFPGGRGGQYRSLPQLLYLFGFGLGASCLVYWGNSSESFHLQAYHFYGAITLAVYLAMFGLAYRYQPELVAALKSVGMPDVAENLNASRSVITRGQFWLGLGVVVMAMLSTFYLVQEDDAVSGLRYWAALMPLLVICGWQIFDGSSLESFLRSASLNLLLITMTILLWAGLSEDLFREEVWFHRITRLFIACSLLALVVFIARKKVDFRGWNTSVQNWLTQHCGMTVVVLLVLFLIELTLIQPHHIMSTWELVGTSAGVMAMMAMLLMVALNPEFSPLQPMTVAMQKGAVYAAELMLFALFGQIYLGNPELFGLLKDQWPFVIMAISFVGVFVSEFFHRREQHVLAEPLHNSAFLLPAIPLLTLWIFPLEGGDRQYSTFIPAFNYCSDIWECRPLVVLYIP